MKVKIIVQAREGSIRFPNKWKADINGRYSIDYVIDACKKSIHYNNNIVFVIPKQDKELIKYINSKNIPIVHDNKRNVYKGFIDCGGDIQVRVTGDSPCISEHQIDMNIQMILQGYEYASNEVTKFGNSCESFTWNALNKYPPEQSGDAEHVTLALRRNSKKRWLPSLMLDYEENLETISKYLTAVVAQ